MDMVRDKRNVVQSLCFLKFQASSHHLWLYSPKLVGNPEDRFSRNMAHISFLKQFFIFLFELRIKFYVMFI